MAKDIKESINTIKNTVLVNIHGLMGKHMKALGSMASSMGKPSLLILKDALNLVFLKKANELNG